MKEFSLVSALVARVPTPLLQVARTLETRVANPIVQWLLRSPVHWLASFAVVLVTYRGRRSGRKYTIPVAYARTGGTLVVVTPKAETVWWTNFRESAACTLWLHGERRSAEGVVVTDAAIRTDLLETYAAQRRVLARVLGGHRLEERTRPDGTSRSSGSRSRSGSCSSSRTCPPVSKSVISDIQSV